MRPAGGGHRRARLSRNGRNGLLVPARDSGALAAALRQLIEDPALRQRFGARSREKALQEFADDVVVAATLRLYRGDSFASRAPHE